MEIDMKVEFLPNPEKGKTPIALARPENPQEALLAQIWLDLVQDPNNNVFVTKEFEEDGSLRDISVFINDEPGNVPVLDGGVMPLRTSL